MYLIDNRSINKIQAKTFLQRLQYDVYCKTVRDKNYNENLQICLMWNEIMLLNNKFWNRLG